MYFVLGSHWMCQLIGRFLIPCPNPGWILESFLNIRPMLVPYVKKSDQCFWIFYSGQGQIQIIC